MNQPESRTFFHLSDILSITTGRMVSTRGMEGVLDILEHLTGEEIFTSQIPRTIEVCAPALLDQLPQLRGIEASNLNKRTFEPWLAEQVRKFGENLEVLPLNQGQYEPRNVLVELSEQLGKDKDRDPPAVPVKKKTAALN